MRETLLTQTSSNCTAIFSEMTTLLDVPTYLLSECNCWRIRGISTILSINIILRTPIIYHHSQAYNCEPPSDIVKCDVCSPRTLGISILTCSADERPPTWIIWDYSHIQGMVLAGGEFGGPDRTMFELCKYITIPCSSRHTMGAGSIKL